MPDTLPVHVNREELHALEVPDAFETTGSFDVALVNHGASVHVHLHLDDALSEVATIDASNHFIDGEARRVVRVHVNDSGPVTGKLKIASAYGAQTRYVDVSIVEPEETEDHVEVDESLSEPQPGSPTVESTDGGGSLAGGSLSGSGGVGGIAANPELIVLVLGLLAVAVAVVAAVVIEETVVLLGALAVLAGVLVAMYVLVSGS